MKFIAISILICLLAYQVNCQHRNYMANSEIQVGSLNLDRVEYISADFNFAIIQSTAVSDDFLTWYNQYFNATSGIMYHVDGNGCFAGSFEPFSLGEFLQDVEDNSEYLGKRGAHTHLIKADMQLPGINETVFVYWNEETQVSEKIQGLMTMKNGNETITTTFHGGYSTPQIDIDFKESDFALPQECHDVVPQVGFTGHPSMIAPGFPEGAKRIQF